MIACRSIPSRGSKPRHRNRVAFFPVGRNTAAACGFPALPADLKSVLMDEPDLIREIGKVAWIFFRVALAVFALGSLLFFLFRRNPVLGTVVLLGAVIVFIGWTNYKDKKRDLEWRRRDEERDREWNDARRRLDKSA